jgi:nucleotide-binding universal stress UspA family protein
MALGVASPAGTLKGVRGSPEGSKVVSGREVLAGADGSSSGKRAEEWAAQRATDLAIRLHLVRAVPEPGYFRVPSEYRQAATQAEGLLDAEGHRIASLHPGLEIVTSCRAGETVAVLLVLSQAAEAVVLGSDRRPDRRGEGFGSISFQAAVLCRGPVVVVPDVDPAVPAADSVGVLVGVDGSQESELALRAAGEEALRTGAVLTVLHVVAGGDLSGRAFPGDAEPTHQADPEKLLSGAVRRVTTSCPGLEVHQALETGVLPADALIGAAMRANLLVIGCRGRGGLRKPVGSIAEKVLLELSCPTMIAR